MKLQVSITNGSDAVFDGACFYLHAGGSLLLVKLQSLPEMALMESVTEPVSISMLWYSVFSKASGLYYKLQ